MQRSLRDVTGTEVWPGGAVQTDAQLAAFIRKESWGHHACCTSRMGPANDPASVVDSRFRVFGTARLLSLSGARAFARDLAIVGTCVAFAMGPPALLVATAWRRARG